MRPDIPVLVRTRDDAELEKLMQAGATEVIPETMESSLMVASHLLHLLGMPMREILRKVQEVRSHLTACCAACSVARHALPIDPSHAFREQLYTITLSAGAYAIGKSIEELNLRAAKVVVTALRREGVVGRQPSADTILKEEDVMVLWGRPEDLENAEEILLRGTGPKSRTLKENETA